MKKLSTIFSFGLLVVFVLTTNTVMAQTIYDFNPNTAIPDDDSNGLDDVQTISDTGIIEDVDVDLHITHSWQGDLIITLTHDSITVPLLYRAGQSDGSGFGFGTDNFGTDANRFILDDEASAAYDADDYWGTTGETGTADVSGRWIPYGIFNTGGTGGLVGFDGTDVNGDWTLNVSDNAGQDTGTLVSWSLHVTTTAIPEPSSAFVLLMGMGGLAFSRRRR